jgi:hypothetical protein
MDKNEVSILNPEKDEIKKFVEAYEEEWGFEDKLIYNGCVERMGKVKLYNITEKDVKESIKVFLINWGTMGRVLWREDIKGWEGRMFDSLRKISDDLNTFKELHLEDTDLDKYEESIKKCYNHVKKVVGPVSAAKILHLICPYLFPLWDTGIRKKVSNECSKFDNKRIGDSATGYYKFMIINQKFLKKEDNILLKLSKDYKKPKLRITDEFMWWVKYKV